MPSPANRTICHRFLANQFRLLLTSTAYVLIEHLRRVGLAGTDTHSSLRMPITAVVVNGICSVARVPD